MWGEDAEMPQQPTPPQGLKSTGSDSHSHSSGAHSRRDSASSSGSSASGSTSRIQFRLTGVDPFSLRKTIAHEDQLDKWFEKLGIVVEKDSSGVFTTQQKVTEDKLKTVLYSKSQNKPKRKYLELLLLQASFSSHSSPKSKLLYQLLSDKNLEQFWQSLLPYFWQGDFIPGPIAGTKALDLCMVLANHSLKGIDGRKRSVTGSRTAESIESHELYIKIMIKSAEEGSLYAARECLKEWSSEIEHCPIVFTRNDLFKKMRALIEPMLVTHGAAAQLILAEVETNFYQIRGDQSQRDQAKARAVQHLLQAQYALPTDELDGLIHVLSILYGVKSPEMNGLNKAASSIEEAKFFLANIYLNSTNMRMSLENARHSIQTVDEKIKQFTAMKKGETSNLENILQLLNKAIEELLEVAVIKEVDFKFLAEVEKTFEDVCSSLSLAQNSQLCQHLDIGMDTAEKIMQSIHEAKLLLARLTRLNKVKTPLDIAYQLFVNAFEERLPLYSCRRLFKDWSSFIDEWLTGYFFPYVEQEDEARVFLKAQTQIVNSELRAVENRDVAGSAPLMLSAPALCSPPCRKAVTSPPTPAPTSTLPTLS